MRRTSALHGADSATGASQKAIGAPGSMLIGPCILDRKLGPVTSKGAGVPVPVGGACTQVINVAHGGTGITLFTVGA